MKNSTLAIVAAADTIPKNPKIPATIAIIKKIIDHFNILLTFLSCRVWAINDWTYADKPAGPVHPRSHT